VVSAFAAASAGDALKPDTKRVAANKTGEILPILNKDLAVTKLITSHLKYIDKSLSHLLMTQLSWILFPLGSLELSYSLVGLAQEIGHL
jgi:hypothetical protein